MPAVRSILETCLYVDDMPAAVAFYTGLFGFPVLVADARLTAMAVSEQDVLILFQRGASLAGAVSEFGPIPPHDGSGPMHFAFGIDPDMLEPWRAHLASQAIEVESEVQWPRGGRSLYFRDPAGHLVELATPGIWDFSVLRRGAS